MNILVLGIGHSMRGDDAAGLQAVRLWQKNHPSSAAQVKVEFLEQSGLDLLDLLGGMDRAILVDAVHSPTIHGPVLRLGLEELASFSPNTGSTHGWGVAEALQMGKVLVPSLAQCQVILIGIVGNDFTVGANFSHDVMVGINNAVDMIENEVHCLL